MGRYFKERDLLKLDETLADVEMHAANNDELVEDLAQHLLPAVGDFSDFLSLDPLSDCYKRLVCEVHQEIIGQGYSVTNEGLPDLDLEYEERWPYPWGTKSPQTVARFLIAYGFLIKVANLHSHARILEVGCGLGSLTWNLSRMGYQVDALDPNETQCEGVREATQGFPIAPNVISMPLSEWLAHKKENLSYRYDAVVFFESFHHILDHQECLRLILDDHLHEDGKILLGAEPIFPRITNQFPYPWGPRLDGESIRAQRRWGWLELGFTESYLQILFESLGMSLSEAKCDGALPWSKVYIGQRRVGVNSKSCNGGFGESMQSGFRFSSHSKPAFLRSFSGLGDPEPWGRWSIGNDVTFEFCDYLPSNFTLTVQFADVFGPNVDKEIEVIAGDEIASAVLREIRDQSIYVFKLYGVTGSTLKIKVPHPCSPRDLYGPQNGDTRDIGLAFAFFNITPLNCSES